MLRKMPRHLPVLFLTIRPNQIKRRIQNHDMIHFVKELLDPTRFLKMLSLRSVTPSYLPPIKSVQGKGYGPIHARMT